MKLRYGNMFDHLNECDVLLVTTNSYIKKDGSLAMGRGVALEAKQLFPDLPKLFAPLIHKYSVEYLYKEDTGHVVHVGFFNVKNHFKDKATLSRIAISTLSLVEIAEEEQEHIFFLNYPGIGNGGLTREEVEPIISVLPNNVHVWIKE